VTTQYGFTASAAEAPIGPHLLRGKDINKTSFVDWSSVPYCEIDDESWHKFRLNPGDICVIRMADPGKVGIVETSTEAVFASYLVRLQPTDDRLPPYLLFHFLDSPDYLSRITGSSTGSTRKSASAKVLTEPLICVPTLRIARRFQGSAEQIRGRLSNLVTTNAQLATTRDLLLPRLVTGRLDISDLDLGVLAPPEVE
jgi:type I restriction enzyme S subunit